MRRSLLAMFILAILFLNLSAGLIHDLNPRGDVSVMDGDLIDHLSTNDSIEVIAQFTTSDDFKRQIAQIGLETLGEMRVLHGGLYEGLQTKSVIFR